MAGGILDALREGRRYIVHSDEPLSAFLELEPPQIRLKCVRSVRSGLEMIRSLENDLCVFLRHN